MIEKKTVLDQIELTRANTVQVRLALLMVEDGVEIECRYHRTVLPVGVDVDQQIAAVNAHLATMNREPVPADAVVKIKQVAALLPAA